MTLRSCVRFILAHVAFAITASTGVCTDQERDVIVIDGKDSLLLDCPLIYYWNEDNNPRPNFDMNRTSNWKGFTVRWEIKDNKLWVTGFEANQRGKLIDPVNIFGKPLPIHAIWVNGPEYVVDNLSGSNIRGFTSDRWQRLFFIDGVIRKRSSGKTLLNCDRGYVGIKLGASNGAIVAENVQENSPAAKFGLRSGTTIAGLVDIDDDAILFHDFPTQKALQCMRGLLDDRLRLLIKPNDAESAIAELVRVRSIPAEIPSGK